MIKCWDTERRERERQTDGRADRLAMALASELSELMNKQQAAIHALHHSTTTEPRQTTTSHTGAHPPRLQCLSCAHTHTHAHTQKKILCTPQVGLNIYFIKLNKNLTLKNFAMLKAILITWRQRWNCVRIFDPTRWLLTRSSIVKNPLRLDSSISKTQNRVKHQVWHFDLWPDPANIADPVTCDPVPSLIQEQR